MMAHLVENTGHNRCRHGLDAQVDRLVVLAQCNTIVATVGVAFTCKPISHLADQSRDCGLVNKLNAVAPHIYPGNLCMVEIIEDLTVYMIAIEAATETTHTIWVDPIQFNKALQMRMPVGPKAAPVCPKPFV